MNGTAPRLGKGHRDTGGCNAEKGFRDTGPVMRKRDSAMRARGSEPIVRGILLLGVTDGYVFDTQCNKIIQFAKLPKSGDVMPLEYCSGSVRLGENQ